MTQDSDPQAAAEITENVTEPVILGIALDEKQQEAIRLCCDPASRVVCITGQAGSGKTTIMRNVYKLLSEAGHNVAVCA
ncbi:AAA family ATPase, partial [Lacticaseibacillus paracasei]